MAQCVRIALVSLLALAAVGFAPGWAPEAAAQSRATAADLAGKVADESGAVLPGVSVTVTNVETNLVRTVTTGPEGRFSIPVLPPGTYTIKLELAGFATETREGLILTLGALVDLDVTLKLAGTTEQVTVLGQASLVDTQKTSVATVVSQQQIASLPINGRSFISFSIITPGVTTDRTPQQGASATSGLTFAGQRARSNNITVDGLDNNDATVGSVRAVFSQEAVREFQVLTNSYSAEFGKASGGVVNIVTKSGTNRTDGNVFAYYRDDALNAKEHFEKYDTAGNAVTRDKAPFKQLQFGATLGGPVVKDKVFYFLAVERLDIDTNNFVTIDDRTPITLFGAPLGTAADIIRRAGFPIQTGNVPYTINTTSILGKVDHQFSANQSLAVRVNWSDAYNENVEPWGGQTAKSRGAYLDSQDVMGALSYTSVLSDKLVNEMRVQYATRDQKVIALDPLCSGECDEESEGGPTLEITGVASVGRQRFTPQPRRNDRFEVTDTLSFYSGTHQFKIGFDWNYIDHKSQALPLHFGGRYIFAPLPAIPGVLPAPITSIQAVALGLPAAYVQGYGNSNRPYGYQDLSLFAQDDWRIKPNLTLKYGIRYQNQFWPAMRYDTVRGIDPYSFPSDNNNVAPRLAIAWDPGGQKKTSIHGSYGIYYDNHITAVAGITDLIDGKDQVRTLVARFPNSLAGWRAPGHKAPEAIFGAYPSLVISIDPGLKTPYAHHASIGFEQEIMEKYSFSASFVYARGLNQLGTIDYNPVVPALGAGRRPEDVVGPTGPVPGSSASILQYTSFGETWYRGLTMSVTRRFSDKLQFLMSYTLSKAEDNSTDYQSAFIAMDNGRGRDDGDPTGLPVGFNADNERGSSLQDQRHRFVFSGLYVFPAEIQLSTIITVASGRPYSILAGADLNGDADGGAFPSDRARQNPLDASSSVGRNTGTMPNQATVDIRLSRRFGIGKDVSVDGIFEVFNLFNRTNYTEINNIFGTGAYPSNPEPTFGQFQQAGSPLQIQLAARINF
jgi:hypothetical protein